MPENGLAEIAGASVVQERGVAIHLLHQPDAPQRRRAPFASVGLEGRPAVGEFIAQVMQQQVGVGADGLVGEFWILPRRCGLELGLMAFGAAGFAEQLPASLHERIGNFPTRRHTQQTGVGDHIAENFVADLRRVLRRLLRVHDLQVGVVLPRVNGRGDANVLNECSGDLLVDGRLLGLPAEATGRFFTGGLIPDEVHATRDAVAITIIGIGKGVNGFLRHGFEQAHANHGGSDAR